MKLETVLEPTPEQLSLPIVGRLPNLHSEIGNVETARHLSGASLRGLFVAVQEFVALRRKLLYVHEKQLPDLADRINDAAERIEDAWRALK